MGKYTLLMFRDDDKRVPFTEWLESLKDKEARYAIKARLNRIALGNFGDCAFVGSGVFELKIRQGPGYRVYYAKLEKEILLLLCGGDKSTQKQDIKKAITYWERYNHDRCN